jgi:hypothetical protein
MMIRRAALLGAIVALGAMSVARAHGALLERATTTTGCPPPTAAAACPPT